MRRAGTVSLLLALSLLAGCGGCQGKKTEAPDPGPAAYLPAATPRAATVENLGRLGSALAELQKTKLASLLAAAAGQQNADDLVKPLVRQLGFDPRTAEGIAGAGIDPARGLAVGEDGDTQLLVLAAADPARIDAYLDGLGKRAGGEVVKESPLPGGATARAYGPADLPPRMAFARIGRYAVVARDGDVLAALTRAVQRTPAEALTGNATFTALRGKLAAADVVIWSAPGAEAFPGAPASGGVAGLTLARTGISARVVALPRPEALAALRPLGKPAGDRLMPQLPEGSFLALRLGGDPAALQPFLEKLLPPRLVERFHKAGLDVRADMLEKLEPGVVVGVGLSPDIDLSGGLPSGDSLDVNRTNPFRFVDLTVLAQVKDPAAATGVLGRLPALGEQLRFSVAKREEKGVTVWSSTYAGGEGMTWALAGKTLVATGGKDAFPRALARVEKAQPPFAIEDPKVKASFERAASAAYLDVPRLTAALRGIPELAYGVGGFRIKQVVERWTDLLAEVQGVAATFSVDDAAVIVDLELALK